MRPRDSRPVRLLFRFAIRRARTLLPILVKPITAPGPHPRLGDESAFHRIPVHIVQLLAPLLRTPQIEIIKPPPETPPRLRRRLGPQSHLTLIRSLSPLSSQALRHALLQGLHHRRRRAHFRLRNQQINVLGHHHVADQPELIALARRIQNPQKHVPLPRRSQQGPAWVTATRNKMQVPLTVAPLQLVTYRLGHSCAPSLAVSLDRADNVI
jgi:hypothetical protein